METEETRNQNEAQVKTGPSSIRKKKTYRVVESRYMKTSKSGQTPSSTTNRVTPRNQQTLRSSPFLHSKAENQKVDDSIASTNTTISEIKISTPHRDVIETPVLDFNEISSINSTLKDAGNQSIQSNIEIKNPLIRRPLLNKNLLSRKLQANQLLTQQKVKSLVKKENVPLKDGPNMKNKNLSNSNNVTPVDLDVLYSQYLVTNYMASHGQKNLEIQEKDHHRLLHSIALSNKALVEENTNLEKRVLNYQKNRETEELIEKQIKSLAPLEEQITDLISIFQDIEHNFKTMHSQMLLKNIKFPDKSIALEKNIKDVSTKMAEILTVGGEIHPLLSKLSEEIGQILQDKDGKLQITEKSCQKLLRLTGLEMSLYLQKQIGDHKSSHSTNEIDNLIYNW